VLCVVGCAIVGVLAFEWPLARSHDASSLAAFMSLTVNARVAEDATWITEHATAIPFVILGAALMLVAVLRRRPRLAFVVPIAMGGSNATTEALKQGIAHLRFSALLGYDQIASASFPSGHATAAMSAALCAVVVAPPLVRPLASLFGAAFSLAVSYSILIAGWHYPSDVLGGYFVAGAWIFLALAALGGSELLRPSRTAVAESTTIRAASIPAALGLGIIAAALVTSALVSGPAQIDGSLIIGAALVAALALALPTGLLVALRPRNPARAAGAAGTRGRPLTAVARSNSSVG
jgi:membrane-associated phospholipid phosphatase